jgi:hypothetical protein
MQMRRIVMLRGRTTPAITTGGGEPSGNSMTNASSTSTFVNLADMTVEEVGGQGDVRLLARCRGFPLLVNIIHINYTTIKIPAVLGLGAMIVTRTRTHARSAIRGKKKKYKEDKK